MTENFKILVVDDDPNVREVIKTVLKRYHINEATNGREAIDMCDEERFDLILMDIRMPEMDGIEATKTILKRYPETKIIAVTAYATHIRERILDAGVLKILEKPFKINELKKLVEDVGRIADGIIGCQPI